MRQIVFDTETTGLEPEQGHRIIEIGCVEMVNRRKTGRTFHRYLRPDREVEFLRLGLADAVGTSLARLENVVVRSALALPAGC